MFGLTGCLRPSLKVEIYVQQNQPYLLISSADKSNDKKIWRDRPVHTHPFQIIRNTQRRLSSVLGIAVQPQRHMHDVRIGSRMSNSYSEHRTWYVHMYVCLDRMHLQRHSAPILAAASCSRKDRRLWQPRRNCKTQKWGRCTMRIDIRCKTPTNISRNQARHASTN